MGWRDDGPGAAKSFGAAKSSFVFNNMYKQRQSLTGAQKPQDGGGGVGRKLRTPPWPLTPALLPF